MTLRLEPKEYALLVRQVLRRDGYKCQSCGSRNNLAAHHVWFRSHGGPDMLWNLVTLCTACHNGAHKDVKDGQYGLEIRTDMNGFTFIRRVGWKPR
jgi:5-methylcytosine-specific restriction endonuclease McrA